MSRKLVEPMVSKSNRRKSTRERNQSKPRIGGEAEPLANLLFVSAPPQGWYRLGKRGCDIALALALLALSAPVFLMTALLIRFTSRGPAIYSQTRVGANGRHFTIYKFRTMIHNCESLTGARWAIPGDPRITPLGHFLRVSHLDELPQLWNVLRGDMSLVGPRPERPEFIPTLERAIPLYTQRLRVRPGITGMAQVQLPPDIDLESVKRKLACDLFYVREQSAWLDFRILLCTATKVLGIPFQISQFLFKMPSWHSFERAVENHPNTEVIGPLRKVA